MSRLDLYDRFNMNCVNTEDCSKCKCCDDEAGDLVLCALMFGYQQGRADERTKVIDEVKVYASRKADEMNMRTKNAEEKSDILSAQYFSGAMWHLMEVKEFLEQLKEQRK